MNSFRNIGAKGAANLATVAPGIAEALVATAIGLMAAIPAVMAYNYFSLRRIKVISNEMDTFSNGSPTSSAAPSSGSGMRHVEAGASGAALRRPGGGPSPGGRRRAAPSLQLFGAPAPVAPSEECSRGLRWRWPREPCRTRRCSAAGYFASSLRPKKRSMSGSSRACSCATRRFRCAASRRSRAACSCARRSASTTESCVASSLALREDRLKGLLVEAVAHRLGRNATTAACRGSPVMTLSRRRSPGRAASSPPAPPLPAAPQMRTASPRDRMYSQRESRPCSVITSPAANGVGMQCSASSSASSRLNPEERHLRQHLDPPRLLALRACALVLLVVLREEHRRRRHGEGDPGALQRRVEPLAHGAAGQGRRPPDRSASSAPRSSRSCRGPSRAKSKQMQLRGRSGHVGDRAALQRPATVDDDHAASSGSRR